LAEWGLGNIFCDYGTDGGSLSSLFVGIAAQIDCHA